MLCELRGCAVLHIFRQRSQARVNAVQLVVRHSSSACMSLVFHADWAFDIAWRNRQQLRKDAESTLSHEHAYAFEVLMEEVRVVEEGRKAHRRFIDAIEIALERTAIRREADGRTQQLLLPLSAYTDSLSYAIDRLKPEAGKLLGLICRANSDFIAGKPSLYMVLDLGLQRTALLRDVLIKAKQRRTAKPLVDVSSTATTEGDLASAIAQAVTQPVSSVTASSAVTVSIPAMSLSATASDSATAQADNHDLSSQVAQSGGKGAKDAVAPPELAPGAAPPDERAGRVSPEVAAQAASQVLAMQQSK